MKDIRQKIEEFYRNLNEILENGDDAPKLSRRQNNTDEKRQLMTGIVVVLLIVTIVISMGYYFLHFAPEEKELSDLKQEKINRLNELLPADEEATREAITSRINACEDKKSLDTLDVEAMSYPVLKKALLSRINEYRDKYDRVEVQGPNTTDIMKTSKAKKYIDSMDARGLSEISVRPVDSVIIPLSIKRKQAASGLVRPDDVVDIYVTKNNIIKNEGTDSLDEYNDTSVNSRVVGGSRIVSILRSRDSAVIDQKLELSRYPKSRNLSQSSSLDLQQVMSSKAAGLYDEGQVKVLLDAYAERLSTYERTSSIGELDVDYIIMVEVPSQSVEYLIDNMDNIILTIPTYDAPSWVRL